MIVRLEILSLMSMLFAWAGICSVIEITSRREDVTSNEFRQKATITYQRVLNCLTLDRPHAIANKSSYEFPIDAELHFEEIYNKTRHFRQSMIHYYAGYGGPWIENHWIQSFEKLPLSAFGGLIPIFAQWIDIEIRSHPDYNHKRDELLSMLRPNVLYIAVSQGDKGLGNFVLRTPNVLVLSAGGYGHVPIPLVRSHLDYVPPPEEYKYDISFLGKSHHSRQAMLQQISQLASNRNLTFFQGYGDNWLSILLSSRYNLAPRGYGRSSFRYTEIIQSGRLPVFLHDNGEPWIPYLGTNVSIEEFGFYASMSNHYKTIPDAIASIANTTHEEFIQQLRRIKELRSYYTYEGILNEILLFMSDPFGPNGGHLRCAKLPNTEN